MPAGRAAQAAPPSAPEIIAPPTPLSHRPIQSFRRWPESTRSHKCPVRSGDLAAEFGAEGGEVGHGGGLSPAGREVLRAVSWRLDRLPRSVRRVVRYSGTRPQGPCVRARRADGVVPDKVMRTLRGGGLPVDQRAGRSVAAAPVGPQVAPVSAPEMMRVMVRPRTVSPSPVSVSTIGHEVAAVSWPLRRGRASKRQARWCGRCAVCRRRSG